MLCFVLQLLFAKSLALREYDCSLDNFEYAGFNQGPDLDDDGFCDMKKLKEKQMRILRPKQGRGGCAFGDDFSFLVRRGNTLSKVVIEFAAGGACWDFETCARNDNRKFTDTELLETKDLIGHPLLDCAIWGDVQSSGFSG